MILSRRAFNQSLLLPLGAYALDGASAAALSVRYDADSRRGKRMLALYEKAVARMKLLPLEDPSSWRFQWYIHSMPKTVVREDELNKIKSQEVRRLAENLWSTCEPHKSNVPELFLPWHRMFVYYFERIVRKHCGDPAFTLPYWNYSRRRSGSRGVLPALFRDPNSSLYCADRTPDVNRGLGIEKNDPTFSLSALGFDSFEYVGPYQPGFSAWLETGVHQNVHAYVGTATNMGAIDTAAQDPIFWAHHCNIDRLWASWGPTIPIQHSEDWLSHEFDFVDENGIAVRRRVGDFVNGASLPYTYDILEQPIRAARTSGPSRQGGTKEFYKATNVKWGSVPVTTPMNQLATIGEPGSYFLVLRGLRAEGPATGNYIISLDFSEPNATFIVGSVSLFGFGSHHTQQAQQSQSGSVRFLSLTDKVNAILSKNFSPGVANITISPRKGPATSSALITAEEIVIFKQN